MEKTNIRDLIPNECSKICGFVEAIRKTKNNYFVVVRDRSQSIQLYINVKENPEMVKTIDSINVESTIEVIGVANLNPYVKNGGIEFIPESISVVSVAVAGLPIDSNSSPELRMDWRYLDLRNPKNLLIFELQTVIEHAMREYWMKNGFIEIHTPKLMSTSSESGSELFKLDYFGGKAYLSQSPQFYKQMAMNAGFEKIFEIGPVFRANPSFTARHETEFISVDAEISWIRSHEDIMKLEEEWIAYFMAKAQEKLGEKVDALYGIAIEVPKLPFPRISLAEAKEIIRRIRAGEDFTKLAKELSLDPTTKDNGGQMDFTNVRQISINGFGEAAMAMEKGSLLPIPFKSVHGYHVVKLLDKREVPFPSFEALKPRLERSIVQQRTQEFINQKIAEAKIEDIKPAPRPAARRPY